VDDRSTTVIRIEPRTTGTVHVTLYCTWRPSGMATGLSGQGLKYTWAHYKYSQVSHLADPWDGSTSW